jgi:hypothetical protein
LEGVSWREREGEGGRGRRSIFRKYTTAFEYSSEVAIAFGLLLATQRREREGQGGKGSKSEVERGKRGELVNYFRKNFLSSDGSLLAAERRERDREGAEGRGRKREGERGRTSC